MAMVENDDGTLFDIQLEASLDETELGRHKSNATFGVVDDCTSSDIQTSIFDDDTEIEVDTSTGAINVFNRGISSDIIRLEASHGDGNGEVIISNFSEEATEVDPEAEINQSWVKVEAVDDGTLFDIQLEASRDEGELENENSNVIFGNVDDCISSDIQNNKFHVDSDIEVDLSLGRINVFNSKLSPDIIQLEASPNDGNGEVITSNISLEVTDNEKVFEVESKSPPGSPEVENDIYNTFAFVETAEETDETLILDSSSDNYSVGSYVDIEPLDFKEELGIDSGTVDIDMISPYSDYSSEIEFDNNASLVPPTYGTSVENSHHEDFELDPEAKFDQSKVTVEAVDDGTIFDIQLEASLDDTELENDSSNETFGVVDDCTSSDIQTSIFHDDTRIEVDTSIGTINAFNNGLSSDIIQLEASPDDGNGEVSTRNFSDEVTDNGKSFEDECKTPHVSPEVENEMYITVVPVDTVEETDKTVHLDSSSKNHSVGSFVDIDYIDIVGVDIGTVPIDTISHCEEDASEIEFDSNASREPDTHGTSVANYPSENLEVDPELEVDQSWGTVRAADDDTIFDIQLEASFDDTELEIDQSNTTFKIHGEGTSNDIQPNTFNDDTKIEVDRSMGTVNVFNSGFSSNTTQLEASNDCRNVELITSNFSVDITDRGTSVEVDCKTPDVSPEIENKRYITIVTFDIVEEDVEIIHLESSDTESMCSFVDIEYIDEVGIDRETVHIDIKSPCAVDTSEIEIDNNASWFPDTYGTSVGHCPLEDIQVDDTLFDLQLEASHDDTEIEIDELNATVRIFDDGISAHIQTNTFHDDTKIEVGTSMGTVNAFNDGVLSNIVQLEVSDDERNVEGITSNFSVEATNSGTSYEGKCKAPQVGTDDESARVEP